MNETTTTTVEEIVENDVEFGGFISRISIICALIMNVMCIMGIVANSLSFYIYTRPTFNKRSINVFLAALSAADFIVCVLAVPVFSISQLQSLMPGTPMITATVMLYFYPVTLMAQTMSVWLLVAITIDRYLAVCHPFIVASYCTKKRAMLTVAIILIFSIAYNFIRFWEFTLNEQVSLESGVVEDMLQPLLRADKMYLLLYQNLLTLATQFILPVAVLFFIFCYAFSFMLNVLEIVYESLFRSSFGYLLNDINNILICLNSSTSFIFYCKYSTRYRAQLMRTCSLGFVLKRFMVSPGRGDKGTVILSECSALVNTTVPSPGHQPVAPLSSRFLSPEL
ncbi:frpr-3 [Pristionchus pacificus]|uniref:Frpr-3 n=1 Tax=Pristionchus pacificus TaxID=54126 RepID=A0A2A6CZ10_PRIPA|nr:frpr-3 [Pristionchus pacificus]|eukprot:PDM83263.1 frpr-3 [Pristionchus pacificus]